MPLVNFKNINLRTFIRTAGQIQLCQGDDRKEESNRIQENLDKHLFYYLIANLRVNPSF